MMVPKRYHWQLYTGDREYEVNETCFDVEDYITSDFSSNQMINFISYLQNYSEQGEIYSTVKVKSIIVNFSQNHSASSLG